MQLTFLFASDGIHLKPTSISANDKDVAPDVSSIGDKKYGNKIFLVDDDEDIVKILKRGLELQGGFHVDGYTSSQQALDAFKPNMYDLAILDVRMPGLNGFSLCRKMKEIDPAINACFLSAFEIDPDEFKKVFPSSGDNIKAIIKKPVTISNLIRKITPVLKQSSIPSSTSSERYSSEHIPGLFLSKTKRGKGSYRVGSNFSKKQA